MAKAKKAVKKVQKAKPSAKRRVAKKPQAKKPVVKKRTLVKTKKIKKTTTKPAGSAFEKIGEVTHYFPHVNAAAVKLLKSGLAVGDQIYIKGHTSDFKEKVDSIQLDRVSIREGKKGQEIGLLVKARVRIGDIVYRI